DARVIGEAGSDAHDLGVAAVDQETSIHFNTSLNGFGSRDRQRGGGRHEQERGNEGTGNGGGDLPGGSQCEQCFTPLLFALRTRPSGPRQIQCTGHANSEISFFFSVADWRLMKIPGAMHRELVICATTRSARAWRFPWSCSTWPVVQPESWPEART